MPHFVKDLGSSKDMISFTYSGTTKLDIYKQVDEILILRKYKKIGESNGGSTYEYGNRTSRILLGAFIKYFKFHVHINELETDMLEVRIIRATSGMSGGLIGVNQVTKEMTEISMSLKQL